MGLKIISGGQTGADQAGLYAAKCVGIETGGYAPAGFMTLDGVNFRLREMFNLVSIAGGYKRRTWLNVEHSDCTIRFAFDFKSRGEICTLNAIKHFNKPHFDVPLNYPITLLMIQDIGDWIIENDFEVINIAGNAQSKTRDVYTPVYSTMCKILDYIKE